MASLLYNKAKAEFLKGGIDWDTDTIKVLLVATGYTPSVDHNFVSDITNEVGTANYVRKTLSCTVAEDDANDRGVADASDVVWTALGAGATVIGVVAFKDTGNDATSPLIYFGDFTDTATNGGDFTLQWHADGLFYW
jgi:hypothetical protein